MAFLPRVFSNDLKPYRAIISADDRVAVIWDVVVFMWRQGSVAQSAELTCICIQTIESPDPISRLTSVGSVQWMEIVQRNQLAIQLCFTKSMNILFYILAAGSCTFIHGANALFPLSVTDGRYHITINGERMISFEGNPWTAMKYWSSCYSICSFRKVKIYLFHPTNIFPKAGRWNQVISFSK